MRWPSIANITFKELVRSKVLYGVFGITIFLELMATAFGAASIGELTKIVKDFGLFLVTMSVVSLATLSGSNLMTKEITKKTIYNLLSKPVHRFEFVLGKYAGILMLCIVVNISLTCLLAGYVMLLGGSGITYLFTASYYVGLESLILCGCALFFSALVTTPSLSGILTFGLFLTGRGLQEIYGLTQNSGLPDALRELCRIGYWILPQTFRFSVSNDIVYGIVPTFGHDLECFVYALSYAGILLLLSTALFSKRDFN